MAKPDQFLDLARKMSSDPRIQRQIAESFLRISMANPALGARLAKGDPMAVKEAYQLLVANGGSIPIPSGPPRLGSSPIGPGETVGGVAGPGVPVSPGTAMVPAPPRGLPHDPSQTRALTTTGGDAPDALESAARELSVTEGGELIPYEQRGPGVRVGGLGGPPVPYTPRLRGKPTVVDATPPRREIPNWVTPAVAGAYATAVGIGALNSSSQDESVENNLNAAAAELAPDADVAAPAARTTVTREPYNPMAGPTAMYDGVEVPVFLGSDGQPLMAPNGGQYVQLGAVRAAKEAEEAAFDRAGGRRGVPGPRTYDGRPVTPAPEFRTPEEAEAYFTRPTDDAGRLQPSAADRAMAARGFVPTYTPDGDASYRMGWSHLTGPSDRVRREATYYQNHRVPGKNEPAYVMESADGPTGTFNVLVPSPAMRDYMSNRNDRQSLIRLAARGSTQAREDLGDLTPQEEMRLRNESAEQGRRQLVARNARMVGGSENLNPAVRSRLGTFHELGDPGNNDWQRMVLAETMLRDPQQMTPLGVQAVGANNAMRMMNAQGFGAGMTGELQRERVRQETLAAAVQMADSMATQSSDWLGRYGQDDVDAIRAAVEARYPGLGLSATAHLRPRLSRSARPRNRSEEDEASVGGDEDSVETLPSGSPRARWPVR